MHLNANDDVSQKYPCILIHAISRKIITATPTAPPLPPLPTIDTNNQASVLVTVTASDFVGGPLLSTSTAGDASLTPLKPISTAANVGMEGGSGVVSATATTQPSTDFPSILGVSVVTASDSADAGEAASSVALKTPFPFQQPVVNCWFSNNDESLYDKGYESEGAEM